nr:MAG TPA: hypothetical protein [Caudoviricetes sp.]
MNSPIRRACHSAIFSGYAFRLRNRRLLGHDWQVCQNRNDTDSAAATPFLIARPNSSRCLSESGHRSDLGSGGLLPRHGQDTSGEISNSLFGPIVNLVIPIALIVVSVRNSILCLFRRARHANNLPKDFEHDVHRNRASRTQIKPGA